MQYSHPLPLVAEIQSEFSASGIGWAEARVTDHGNGMVAARVLGPGKEMVSQPEVNWGSCRMARRM